MRAGKTSFVAIASLAALATAVSPAVSHADERAPAPNHYALDLSGVRYGFVRATLEGDALASGHQRLVIGTQDIASPLVTLIDGFAQGKPLKRDVRLTSGAVVRKANDARLVSVKLPGIGSGGSADVELAFVVAALTTQPLLSAKEAPPSPASGRITGFRVELEGMSTIGAPKLDPIALTQKPDGLATTGEIALEVGAGGAPPFVAWQKASAAKPSPRTLRVEYVGSDGAAIVKLQLERCTPSSVKPLGANGTTRITLACAGVRGG
jgi:hypothetical protein